MNIVHNRILLQRLAAEYGLGTLQGAARRRFETLARQNAPVRRAIHEWQERLAGMTELQAAVAPPPAVWTRIEIALRLEREASVRAAARAPAPGQSVRAVSWWQQALVWQGVSVAALSLALLGWWQPWRPSAESSGPTQALRSASQEYLALLLDADNRPAWLASWDSGRQQVQLQDLLGQAVPRDHALQLWAVPASGAPRSLGVLGAGEGARVLVAAASQIQGASLLAISLEVPGGVPEAGGPQGPILFKGPLVRKTI